MIQEGNLRERHAIARWNPVNIAQTLGELDSVRVGSRQIDNSRELDEFRYEWLTEKNILSAMDYISAAYLNGDISAASDALSYMKSRIADGMHMPVLARELLMPSVDSLADMSNKGSKLEIGLLKRYLIEHPRDSIMWAELAWHYLILGQFPQAERSLLIAYNISPNNRFVVRAISRFYVHTNDLDKAFYYATKSDITKYDPWTLSNQIAISNMHERTSRLLKNGALFLDNSSVNPGSLSELASELGTMDFSSGNRKKGRKKFQIACKKPHENALAQISWVDHHIGSVGTLALPERPAQCDFESKVYMQLTSTPNWDKIFDDILQWANYQPFSTKPVMMGSFITTNILNDFDAAISLLQHGYNVNKNDIQIKNNFIYTLLLMGQKEAADKIMQTIDVAKLTDQERIHIIATLGLYAYRFGTQAEGKAFYVEAADLAKHTDYMYEYYSVLVHLAREEKLKGNNIESFLQEIAKGREYTQECLFKATIDAFGLFDN